MRKMTSVQIRLNPQGNISDISFEIMFNRFDILYDTYDIWELIANEKKWVVPIHFDENMHTIYAGVSLTNIPRKEFKQFINTLRIHYRHSERIYLENSLYYSQYLTEKPAHLIRLPNTKEEYVASLSLTTADIV